MWQGPSGMEWLADPRAKHPLSSSSKDLAEAKSKNCYLPHQGGDRACADLSANRRRLRFAARPAPSISPLVGEIAIPGFGQAKPLELLVRGSALPTPPSCDLA